MKQKLKYVLISFLLLAFNYSYSQALSYKQILPRGKVLGDSTAFLPYSYPSGSLVSDNGTIYFISGTIKIPFSNWAAFVGLGYKAANIQTGDLSNYTPAQTYIISSAKAAHPWGQFLTYKGKIYYAHSTGIIAVPTQDIFTTNGGNPQWLVTANQYDLADLKAKGSQPELQLADERVYNQPQTYQFSFATNTDNNPSNTTPNAPLNFNPTPTPQPTQTMVPTPTPSSITLTFPTPVNSTLPTPTPTPTPDQSATVSSGPVITSLHPTSGAVGTTITITGTGYTSSGNTVLFKGGSTSSSGLLNQASADGKTIQFTVPSTANAVTAMCIPLFGSSCSYNTNPGTYNITVTNIYGTSNATQFTVTAAN